MHCWWPISPGSEAGPARHTRRDWHSGAGHVVLRRNRVEFEQINEQIERIKIECYRVEEEARRVASPHEKMLRSTSKYVSAETRDIDVASEIELLDETGTGGFGKVFRGMWAGTEVAVKLLHNQVMFPGSGWSWAWLLTGVFFCAGPEPEAA